MRNPAIILLFASALLAGCGHNHDGDEEIGHHHHHHNHEHASGHQHSHEGHEHGEADKETEEHHVDGEIVLSAAMAERFGVRTDTVAFSPMAQTIRATGVVLDAASGTAVVAAPTAGIVKFGNGIMQGAKVSAGSAIATIDARGMSGGDTNLAAKANLDAAKREFERLTPLHADRLVTDDVYNAARAAYEQAKAAYSTGAAAGRATTPIAGTIVSIDVPQGAFVETGTPIATISAARNLQLRVDVPERFRSQLGTVAGVNVRIPGSETIMPLKARRVAASAAMPSLLPGYIPVFFEFENDGNVAPGSTLDAWLTAGAAGSPVMNIPRSALYEQQGTLYIYSKIDDDCYIKLPVSTGASDGVRVAITSGLKGDETIVVDGVTAVRLAETSGVVPEGHSHNH